MNQIATLKLSEPAETFPADLWMKLIKLAELVSVNHKTGTLEILNGRSRIVLRDDGTIIVEGERIIQKASRNIVLNAAKIDLN